MIINPKRTIIYICIIAGITLGAFGFVKGAFNEQINFQGKLSDNNNLAVPDDDYNFQFDLYATDAGGASLWTELCTTTAQITVTNGLFSHLLGSVTALPDNIFNQILWLEVKVGGTSTIPSWETLAPRKKLGAVPAAFESKRLGGYATSSFGILSLPASITGLWSFNNIISIAASSTSAVLTVNQNGSGNLVDFQVATSTKFIITNAGYVGIGTTTPTEMFTIRATSTNPIFGAYSSSSVAMFIIDTNGNITTGNWNGTAIANQYGGTGQNSSAWTGYAYIAGGSWGTTSAPVGGGSDTKWLISGTTMYSTGTVSYVGIGTTTPATTLTVYGTSSFIGNIGIGTTTPTAKLEISVALGETPFRVRQRSVSNQSLTVSALGDETNLAGLVPTVAAVNGGNVVVNGTSHNINLPTGIQAGNLLLAFFVSDGNPTVTFAPGWSVIFNTVNGVNVRYGAWYKIANGTEGSTINASTSASEMTAHTTYRITNYSGTPATGTTVTGVSTIPDPPSLSPSWGSKYNLWIATAGYDVNWTVTGYPSGYVGTRNDYSNNAGGAGIGTAYRLFNAATENPLTFTISSSDDWIAQTLAIAPTTTNWNLVDETSNDDDSTYVYSNTTTYQRDFYNVTNSTAVTSTINSITVYARCRATTTPDQSSLKIVVKAGSGGGAPDTVSEGTATTVTTSYANYSNTWATNPKTSAAWAWVDIDALQIGVSLRTPIAASVYDTRCTQVYMKVNYTTTYLTDTFAIDSSGNVNISTFSIKPISPTELAIYDSTNQQIIIFDEGTDSSFDPIWSQSLSEEFALGTFYQTVTSDDKVFLDTTEYDDYYSDGSFTTVHHEFIQTENFQMFRATTNLPAGTGISATLESSDDDFETVKDYLDINLLNGARNYDAFQLEDAKFFRVVFDFHTQNTAVTPELSYFEIQGFVAESQESQVADTLSEVIDSVTTSTEATTSLENFGATNPEGFFGQLMGMVRLAIDAITGLPRMIIEGTVAVSNGSFEQIIDVAKTAIGGKTITIDNSTPDSELEIESEDDENISFVTYSIVAARREIILSGSGKLSMAENNSARAEIFFHPSFSALVSDEINVIVTPTSYISGLLFVSEKSKEGFVVINPNYKDRFEGTFDWIVIAHLLNPEKAQEILARTTEDIAYQEDETIEAEVSCSHEGIRRGCGSYIGACEPGRQVCENGVWGECIGRFGPAEEVCDGIDNDCDEQIDENLQCGNSGDNQNSTATENVIQPEDNVEPTTTTEPAVNPPQGNPTTTAQ